MRTAGRESTHKSPLKIYIYIYNFSAIFYFIHDIPQYSIPNLAYKHIQSLSKGGIFVVPGKSGNTDDESPFSDTQSFS